VPLRQAVLYNQHVLRFGQEMRLSPAAANVYMLTSGLVLTLGVLPWDQYLLRLRFIRDNAEPDSLEAKAAGQVLASRNADTEEEWPLSEQQQKEPEATPSESQVFVPEDEPGVLYFLAAGSTGLSQWWFHQADPDFFPSIPHGHLRSDMRRKLDAYRGWIWRGDEQIDREPRWKVIALWNDEKFRSFASTAIEFYLASFPRYVWPVRNPRRLPRRR
jgi:hypothetical protein